MQKIHAGRFGLTAGTGRAKMMDTHKGVDDQSSGPSESPNQQKKMG